jgi:hypothetical protein
MLKQAVRTATTALPREKIKMNSGQILYQTNCTVTHRSAKENASKMNRFPQQILFHSKTKKPCNSWPISGRFGEITDP